MRYIKKYEVNLGYEPNYSSVKKGDTVIFIDKRSILNTGEKYIVEDTIDGFFKVIDNTDKKNAQFLTVKDLNGNVITDKESKPMLFYSYRFMPELEYYANKYNI